METEKKELWLAPAGAVVSALAASLCCIVPFAAALLGIAGFGASEFLGSWRPYLLVTTLGLLGFGFYMAYRRQPGQGCSSGASCGRTSLGRWNRTVVWIATVFVLGFSAFPYYGGRLVQAVSSNSKPAGSVPTSPEAQLVLKIGGMDCPVCAEALQNGFRQIPGVRQSQVSFQDKQATIEYDPRRVDRVRLVKVITDAGFKVVATLAGN